MKKKLILLGCFFIKVLNYLCIKKDGIIFIPHLNCKNDNYDIINYKSDNVLVVFNRIIKDNRFNNYTLYVICHNQQKIDEYRQYVSSFERKGEVCFIPYSRRFITNLLFIKSFFKSKFVFTTDLGHNFTYKTSSQKIISLGYYTPFKDDSWIIERAGFKKTHSISYLINKSFDYNISTSMLTSRIVSIDLCVFYPKCKPLGFPRNDELYHPSKDLRRTIVNHLGCNVKYIYCYTPTYRDFERTDLPLGLNEQFDNKTIWGNKTVDDDEKLNRILSKHDSVVIVKMHPWQAKHVLFSSFNDKIIHFDTLQKEIQNLSLYDLLAISDGLITDYTSTSFDYLHINKPIIYYFYDYERYKTNRGFSFEPIQSFCGGPIAYSYDELLFHLEELCGGKDLYKNKRLEVHKLVNKYHDDKSYDRLANLMLNVGM